MESSNTIEQVQGEEIPKRNKVHWILAHSYTVYFILLLVGICFDFIFPIKIFTSPLAIFVGIIIVGLASLLILWAQKTSRDLKKENLSKETFYQGPYRYTRGPTHLGLFLLILGFGMIANAPFVILLTFVAFLIGKFIFLDKQEAVLEEKYGAPYREYKKLVKF